MQHRTNVGEIQPSDGHPLPNQGHIQSIHRAVRILRSFTEAEPELSVTALSRRLGLHKSTISRILGTLQQEGLVGQNAETGRYRLGLGLISLAGVALGRIDVRGAAQPHLDALLAACQETVNVTVLDGAECVNIDRLPSPKPLRYVGWIGRRTPLHCTASGKVILAFLSPDIRERLLTTPLARYTERTIVDRPALDTALADICRRGYAEAVDEFEEGFSAIAGPIFDHDGRVVASISVSGPSFRLGPPEMAAIVEPLLAACQAVSSSLGFRGPVA